MKPLTPADWFLAVDPVTQSVIVAGVVLALLALIVVGPDLWRSLRDELASWFPREAVPPAPVDVDDERRRQQLEAAALGRSIAQRDDAFEGALARRRS